MSIEMLGKRGLGGILVDWLVVVRKKEVKKKRLRGLAFICQNVTSGTGVTHQFHQDVHPRQPIREVDRGRYHELEIPDNYYEQWMGIHR